VTAKQGLSIVLNEVTEYLIASRGGFDAPGYVRSNPKHEVPCILHVEQHDDNTFTHRRPTQEDNWEVLDDLWPKDPTPEGRLIPCDSSPEFTDDVMRIVGVCLANGYEVTTQDAERAWTIHSGRVCAGWLCLPSDDQTLFSCVLGACRVLSDSKKTR